MNKTLFPALLGPQGYEIVQLLGSSLPRVSPEERALLFPAYEMASGAEEYGYDKELTFFIVFDDDWREARYGVWSAVKASGRTQMQEELDEWFYVYYPSNPALQSEDVVEWEVAADTVKALLVRDLIGQYGLEQGHYELMTGLWRRFLGPIYSQDSAPVGYLTPWRNPHP